MVISFLALFILFNVPNHYTSNNIFQPSDTIADNKFEMKYKFPQKIPNFSIAKKIDIIYSEFVIEMLFRLKPPCVLFFHTRKVNLYNLRN